VTAQKEKQYTKEYKNNTKTQKTLNRKQEYKTQNKYTKNIKKR
jgi:hypothetical protein